MPTNRPPSLPLFPTCQRWPIRLFLSSAPFCSFLRLTLFSSLLFSFPRSIASFLFRYNSSSPSSLPLILTYPPFLDRLLPIFFAFFLSFSRFFLPLSAAFFLSLLSRSSLVISRLVSSLPSASETKKPRYSPLPLLASPFLSLYRMAVEMTIFSCTGV